MRDPPRGRPGLFPAAVTAQKSPCFGLFWGSCGHPQRCEHRGRVHSERLQPWATSTGRAGRPPARPHRTVMAPTDLDIRTSFQTFFISFAEIPWGINEISVLIPPAYPPPPEGCSRRHRAPGCPPGGTRAGQDRRTGDRGTQRWGKARGGCGFPPAPVPRAGRCGPISPLRPHCSPALPRCSEGRGVPHRGPPARRWVLGGGQTSTSRSEPAFLRDANGKRARPGLSPVPREVGADGGGRGHGGSGFPLGAPQGPAQWHRHHRGSHLLLKDSHGCDQSL